jgi:hypothetical protein
MLPLTCALVSTAWRTALSKEPAKLVAAASAWCYGKPPLRRRGPASQSFQWAFDRRIGWTANSSWLRIGSIARCQNCGMVILLRI